MEQNRATMTVLGTVEGLWRYAVKSLSGERLPSLRFDARGVELDRGWALVDDDGGIASGKTTRRFRKVPELMLHSSHLEGELPVITLADGRSARAGSVEMADLVREIAGAGWSLARENSVSHFDEGSVHVVSTATLATLSAAARRPVSADRLRPNVLIRTAATGFPEEEWIGQALALGDVELRVVSRVQRCVMVNHPRPSLRSRSDVLKTIGAVNGACAGVYADVVTPGATRMGDAVTLFDPS